MNGTWRRGDWHNSVLPQAPLDDRTRAAMDLPRSLRPLIGEGLTQRAVFDPALKPHSNAYRAADPRFDDPAREVAWRAARRAALDTVLAAIAGSCWVDSLVLRGSALMATWFKEAAREPGDLDFVVVPADWDMADPRTTAMFDGIATAAACTAEEQGRGVRLSAAEAISEDIWTYDRVPGRRLVLPWSAPDLPGGEVQIDIVFNEKLAMDPVPTHVPALAGGGEGALVQAATPELSLAWKIVWLFDEWHPQGKDLYDAVLLAERYVLPYDLLGEVSLRYGGWLSADVADLVMERLEGAVGDVEWHHFVAEYPELAGSQEEYGRRLMEALTFGRPPGC